MATKRAITKISIAPGEPVRVEDFRYVDQGLEYNMQNEYDLRDDHLQASRVINWEIFGEAALELDGWTPGDSLLLYVTGVELFITEGLCYIGGRSYVLSANTELFDGATPATNTYNIYLKYTLASNEFAYEYTTSTRTDDHLIKYLLIGTALYTSAVGWSNPIDKRASNTALGAPATVSGSDAGPIFTVENTGSGLGLLVKSSDLQVGEDGTPQILTIWGTNTTGLTLKESGTANTITLSCDATGRMKVAGSINVTATGSTIAGSATVGGVVLNSSAISSVTTLGMSGQLTSTLTTGTAPFSIASSTVVPTLNVDQVDGYDFNQALQTTSSPSFDVLTLTEAVTAPLVISSTAVVANLNVDKVDGYDFNQDVRSTATPSFVRLTLTQGIGTAPMTITSTTMVNNLNAHRVGGNLASAFATSGHTHSWNDLTTATGDVDIGGWELRAKTFESDVAIGTVPIVVTSTTVCPNLNVSQLEGNAASAFATSGHTHSVNALTAMTADKDFGNWQLRAKQFRSDVPTGTAPFVVASTTAVANLTVGYSSNSGQWGGNVFGDYLNQAVKSNNSPTFVGLTLSGAIATPTTITTSSYIDAASYVRCSQLKVDGAPSATTGTVSLGYDSIGSKLKIFTGGTTNYLLIDIDGDTSTGTATFSSPGNNHIIIAPYDDYGCHFEYQATGHVVVRPETNNTGYLGTSAHTWHYLYVTNQSSADIIFANDMRMSEVCKPGRWYDGDVPKKSNRSEYATDADKDGEIPGIVWKDNKGDIVAVLDENGDLFVKGKVRSLDEWTGMKGWKRHVTARAS